MQMRAKPTARRIRGHGSRSETGYSAGVPHPTLLEKHPLLVNLAPDHLELLARAGELESYNPTAQIVSEGSLGDAWFLILSGQVAVHMGALTFATLSGGEFFGEMLRVEPAPRSATVTSLSATFLFRLPHDALRQLIADDPSASAVLLVQVVKTLSD